MLNRTHLKRLPILISGAGMGLLPQLHRVGYKIDRLIFVNERGAISSELRGDALRLAIGERFIKSALNHEHPRSNEDWRFVSLITVRLVCSDCITK